jgi:hypothetical protein
MEPVQIIICYALRAEGRTSPWRPRIGAMAWRPLPFSSLSESQHCVLVEIELKRNSGADLWECHHRLRACRGVARSASSELPPPMLWELRGPCRFSCVKIQEILAAAGLSSGEMTHLRLDDSRFGASCSGTHHDGPNFRSGRSRLDGR